MGSEEGPQTQPQQVARIAYVLGWSQVAVYAHLMLHRLLYDYFHTLASHCLMF